MNLETMPRAQDVSVEGESENTIEALNPPLKIDDDWKIRPIGAQLFADKGRGRDHLTVQMPYQNINEPVTISIRVGDQQNWVEVSKNTTREAMREMFLTDNPYNEEGVSKEGKVITIALPGTEGKRGLQIEFNGDFQIALHELDKLLSDHGS